MIRHMVFLRFRDDVTEREKNAVGRAVRRSVGRETPPTRELDSIADDDKKHSQSAPRGASALAGSSPSRSGASIVGLPDDLAAFGLARLQPSYNTNSMQCTAQQHVRRARNEHNLRL